MLFLPPALSFLPSLSPFLLYLTFHPSSLHLSYPFILLPTSGFFYLPQPSFFSHLLPPSESISTLSPELVSALFSRIPRV